MDSYTRRPQVKRGPLGGLEELCLWCGRQGSWCGIGCPALPVAACIPRGLRGCLLPDRFGR